MSRGPRCDLAIVGMACRFPGAGDLAAFWRNILAGRDATSDVPPDRWDPAEFFDPGSDANDRVYCRRGGFLDDPIPFDPVAHGVMPRAVDGGEPEQFLVLDAARSALADAGLPGGVPDGRRVEVVVGRGNYFNRGNLARLQHGRIAGQTLAILRALHPDWDEARFDEVRAALKSSLPPFEPATIPGQLTNGTAGLAANRLDLRGASFVVDAASASSLVAVDLAARALRERRADLALAGGVYLGCDVDFPMVFCRLGALSRSGVARPFAADADGTLPGEGVGVVVLRRLDDAERDGDRVYAVLKGVGLASDGRGLGLASPSARGHARAIRRAYRAAGVDPATVGLVEGHGLGVPAADRAELRALNAVFPPMGADRRALGAVSSMIGHAMPAAGIAGLIKAALALHHRVLPPTLHAAEPHPLLRGPGARFALETKGRPWVHGDPALPRRAGVNAFGFAGANAHAVLEEHPASADAPASPGALLVWDTEAFLLGAPDRAGLVEVGRALLDWLDRSPAVAPKDLAWTLNVGQPAFACRLGIVAGSLPELADRLRGAVARLDDPMTRSIRDGRGVFFWEREPGARRGLGLVFPGEGSQYPGMLADLCPHFPEVRAQFDTSDRIARAAGAPRPADVLFGDAEGDGLWATQTAVNVVLTAQWALHQLLARLGIRADAVLGHSSGETLALAAAGVVRVDRAFEERIGAMGALFEGLERAGDLPPARLAAAAAGRERVESALGGSGVAVAMDNCPHQVVLAGPPEAVDAAVARLRSEGVVCEVLPFARPYHTPAFAGVLGPIRDFFEGLDFGRPRVPIYSCATAARMPADPAAIRDLAVAQWTRPVRFREAVTAMHADGIDTFVDVGARGNLAGFVEDTLRGRPAVAFAANLPRRSGLTQLNHLVAALYARGVDLRPAHLYLRRRPERVDLSAPIRPAREVPALRVGFPEMTLPADLAARLAARPEPAAVHPLAGLEAALANHARAGDGEADAALVDFFRTMDDFLALQRDVVEAYCAAPAAAGSANGYHGLPGHAASGQAHLNGKHHDATMDLEPSPNPAPDELPTGPWAGEVVAVRPGRGIATRVVLEAAGDPVAENHTLGGRRVSAVEPARLGLPVLPFAVMAEMLAEVARLLEPGSVLVALDDVVAHRWVRYEDEPVSLEITAEAAPDGGIRATIANLGTPSAPREAGPPVFEGIARFAPRRPDPPGAPAFEVEEARPSRFTAGSLYGEQWLFHGPAFQAVSAVGPVGPRGIEGTITLLPTGPLLRDPARAGELLFDPIALDVFTHLLGCWGLDRLDGGDVVFPLRMGKLELFGDDPPPGTPVSCRIAVHEVERHRVRASADLVRPDGRVWMRIGGWDDWRFHWPARYRDVFRRPDVELLGEPLDLPGAEGVVAVWLEPPADMGKPVWRDVLEQTQLGPAERVAHLRRARPDRRRAHSLWGRIAAKEAARRLWLARGGPDVFPADLAAAHDPYGAPRLESLLDPPPGELPAISIAHADGVAVALASAGPGARPGVDVEPIVPRSDEFAAIAFGPGEREWIDRAAGLDRDERIARLWCAKEAAAKATGLGLIRGPDSVSIASADADGTVGVALGPELASARPGLAAGPIRVATARRGDRVWAWTLGET